MRIPVTVYERPNGKRVDIICPNIRDDDANFFTTRSVKISMEECPGSGFAIYADYGAVDEEDEPQEILVFSNGRSCEDTMAELRELVEQAMANPTHHGI